MFVCLCFAVSDREIRSCGARTVEEVGDATGAGTGCGSCHEHIDALLAVSHASVDITDLPATA